MSEQAVSPQRMAASAFAVVVFAGLVWYAVRVRSQPPPPPESGKAALREMTGKK